MVMGPAGQLAECRARHGGVEALSHDRAVKRASNGYCYYCYYICHSVAEWLACWTQAQKGPG